MFRQGDVLLVPVGKIDLNETVLNEKMRKGNKVVLAEGEVTGHAHTMTTETTTPLLFGGREIIVVAEPTPLRHQEHGEIEVSPGTYWVVRQREYTPQAIRRVTD